MSKYLNNKYVSKLHVYTSAIRDDGWTLIF